MDVDLSDVITLGIETKLLLNYPKPLVAVLPVALAVSIVRFSGTVCISMLLRVAYANQLMDSSPSPLSHHHPLPQPPKALHFHQPIPLHNLTLMTL